ncbi:unnamed protein product [Microthlaspi erraticum]|uniref:NB-ARC domain-containing protein n=1 Tax=Microthlaspi erraticum TaxID=1685480 RepID=A0A6D2IGH2_9BRAS|nr:unnamed protein product [Microthlaspi erraticum]
MPILEKLLHLKEIKFKTAAFIGRSMVCSGGGFLKLYMLIMCRLNELEDWVVKEGSMPLLHILEINDCQMLKELPDGMIFITSLKQLRVAYMGVEWKDKLSEGGADYYKVEHIPSVTFV